VRISIIGPLLIAATVAACGRSPTAPSGSLTIRLQDSPFSDAQAVLITFSEVSAHRDTDTDFISVPFAGGSVQRTCDLKKLVGAEDVLGVGSLASGHYTQVRLTVAAATLYFDAPSTGAACAPAIPAPAGASATIDIPSGVVRLNRQFDVPEGGATTIVLDFDGDQSIHTTGNGRYVMTPVVAVASVN